MNTGGLNRKNMAATAGWTWTVNSTTLLDISGAGNEFTSGNRKPVPMSYKPSDAGLPKHLDDFDNPKTDPMNTNFGRVQQQTAALNRFLQFQGRIQFWTPQSQHLRF